MDAKTLTKTEIANNNNTLNILIKEKQKVLAIGNASDELHVFENIFGRQNLLILRKAFAA